jgi:hypothetical protein
MKKGFRFGGKISYKVLDLIGSGWESEVYAVYSSRNELKAAKITHIGEETIKQCPSWGRSDFDLRRSHPFKPLPAKWYSCAGDDLKNEVIDALKLLKQQHALHSQIQRKKLPWIIPLQDYGLLLLPSDNCLTPATFEIMPLVRGATLKTVLDNLNNENLMQSFLNTGRIRAGVDAKAAYGRLADMVVRQLTHGIEALYKNGFAITDADFHPSNLLFGSIDGGGNKVYLIDNRLCAKGCGCDKDELVIEINVIGSHIREWNSKGVLYSAYYDGLVEETI